MGFILVMSLTIAAAVAQAKQEDIIVISRTVETFNIVLPKNAAESLQQESLKEAVDQLTVVLAKLNDELRSKSSIDEKPYEMLKLNDTIPDSSTKQGGNEQKENGDSTPELSKKPVGNGPEGNSPTTDPYGMFVINDTIPDSSTKPDGNEQKENGDSTPELSKKPFDNEPEYPPDLFVFTTLKPNTKPEVESVTSGPSKIQSFYEECNRQTVSEKQLSTYAFNQVTKASVTSVFIHPNIALVSQKGFPLNKTKVKVGNEWRTAEDVQEDIGSAFNALLWTKKVTKKIPICIADDVALGDCHAEFWNSERSDEDPIYKTWKNFKIIRGEECNGGTTICVNECLPNNAAVFCQAPGQFEVFVGFAINCNKGKTRLAAVVDARRWLHDMKELASSL